MKTRSGKNTKTFRVVLVNPEIPWNTGNAGRTCLAFGAELHLVGRLGFSLAETAIRRSGLDYWPEVKCLHFPDIKKYFGGRPPRQCFFFSARAKKSFWNRRVRPGALLVFGGESRGLPRSLKRRFSRFFYKLPHAGAVRSLNLSTAVGIALAEAVRQNSGGRAG